MAINKRPFKVEVGFEDDNIYRLSGTGAPGTAQITIDAPQGSEYINITTGEQWIKIDTAAGDVTDWLKEASISYVDDAFDDLGDVTSEPTGFENRTDSVISFDNGTRTFTIAPAVTDFTFYWKGRKFTKTTAQNKIITDSEDGHYLYFDSNGVLQESQTPIDVKELVFVAWLYWDVSTQTAIALGDERHGLIMDGMTHEYLHNTVGTRYASGLGAGNYSTTGDGTSDAHAQMSIADGVIYDEDIKHTITDGSPQDIAPILKVPIFYREGTPAANWNKLTADNFIVYDNPGDQISWNDQNANGAGDWGMVPAAYGEFVAYWIYATNDINHPIIAFPGQRVDGSLVDAKANNLASAIAFGTLPFVEMKLLYRVIFETDSLTMSNTVHAAIRDVTDFRTTGDQAGTSFVATDHGSLSGLADLDHPASAIVFAPCANISATNAQDAICEVDNENLSLDGSDIMTGDLDMGTTNNIINLADPVNDQDATTKSWVLGQIATQISWREPADVRDNSATLAAIITDMDNDDDLQGEAVYVGMRVLASGIPSDKNIYVVGGSSGSWTLTEADNDESAGDIVYITGGTDAGKTYVYNGTNWVLLNQSDLTELGYIRAFIGKGAVGNELPDYSSNYWINDTTDNLEDAIGKLDAKIGAEVTPNTRTNNPIQTGVSIHTNIENLDDAIGANADFTSTNEISSSNNIIANLAELDDKIGSASWTPKTRSIGQVTITETLNENIEDLDIAIGADVDYVSTTYINTSQNIIENLSDLDAAIVANEDHFAQIAVDGITTTTEVDSVLVDDFEAAKWLLVVTQGQKKRGVVIWAIHNGDTSNDATDVDYTVYARLKMGSAIVGLTIGITLTGSDATQEMNLTVTATSAVNVRALRLRVEA